MLFDASKRIASHNTHDPETAVIAIRLFPALSTSAGTSMLMICSRRAPPMPRDGTQSN